MKGDAFLKCPTISWWTWRASFTIHQKCHQLSSCGVGVNHFSNFILQMLNFLNFEKTSAKLPWVELVLQAGESVSPHCGCRLTAAFAEWERTATTINWIAARQRLVRDCTENMFTFRGHSVYHSLAKAELPNLEFPLVFKLLATLQSWFKQQSAMSGTQIYITNTFCLNGISLYNVNSLVTWISILSIKCFFLFHDVNC